MVLVIVYAKPFANTLNFVPSGQGMGKLFPRASLGTSRNTSLEIFPVVLARLERFMDFIFKCMSRLLRG